MKILVIGGNGTIGRKVTERLKENHEVLVAGRNSGDVQVDFSDSGSIENMFRSVGTVDAIVAFAGGFILCPAKQFWRWPFDDILCGQNFFHQRKFNLQLISAHHAEESK